MVHSMGRSAWLGAALLVTIGCGLLFIWLHTAPIMTPNAAPMEGEVEPVSMYTGPRWHKDGETLDRRQFMNVRSPFVRVESHRVRVASSKVVDDWIWIDIHDAVNVLVEDSDGTFLVFRQTKYALNGESLAVVGGLLNVLDASDLENPHMEVPLVAAKRELLEELGRGADEWITLGTFRTDANRGSGYTTCFLARHTYLFPVEGRPFSDDLEAQKVGENTPPPSSSSTLRLFNRRVQTHCVYAPTASSVSMCLMFCQSSHILMFFPISLSVHMCHRWFD